MRGLGKLFARGSAGIAPQRTGTSDEERHLRELATSRTGVEAYVKPHNAVTTTTAVFVANTGEWTRRRVRDARAAHSLANTLGVPSYDAAVVGYPRRWREGTARRSPEEKARRARGGP